MALHHIRYHLLAKIRTAEHSCDIIKITISIEPMILRIARGLVYTSVRVHVHTIRKLLQSRHAS